MAKRVTTAPPTPPTPTTVKAVTALLLVAAGAGSIGVILVPVQPRWGWWSVLVGLVAMALLAFTTSGGLLAAPPASRAGRVWLARLHQVDAVLLMGLGIRGVDGWWHTPAADRPPMWLAFLALACLGYLSVRLGMTATFLRPSAAREIPTPPPTA